MKSYWKFLFAWWSDDATESDYPAVPGGQVPVLQSDGTVKWSSGAAAGGEVLVEDGAMELVFDDDSGDVLYEG